MPYKQTDCEDWDCIYGWECACAGGTETAYALCGPPQPGVPPAE